MEICDFLKSWKRMCDSMTKMNGCEDCQIVRNTHGARCGDMPCEMQDVESIAREVEKWAAEHPEPVYPSIAKYLEQFGITIRRDGSLEADFFKANEPMSADMAKLLGISSEEGENEKTD